MNKKLYQELNKYVADSAVMYVKLHNFHWNVKGLQFKAVHEYLETLYDGFTENLDSSAEIIRMNGELPLSSMADYLKVTGIKERAAKEVSIKEALKEVLKDLKYFQKSAKNLRELANKEDAFDVANLMEDHCANYEKTIWFIESMTE